MSDEVLKSLIDTTCSNQNIVEFVWHGGEPLFAGIDFYRRVIEYEADWSGEEKKVFNSIQTNGTLIDERWATFFSVNNFAVGVSLDGPSEFHDQLRIHHGGKGSFEETIKAIRLLEDAGVLSDVICCVSSVNCNFPEDIFDFFMEQGIKRLKFLQV
jgi:uncharacterized protein